ncbi:hypothetical protein ACFSR7_18555 [Cohnella sp. GCM10020058]|uniref:hypothetical protein n=1 Tax=Cohnella sp. GCM10020058 TaxID=3317330 RepID=UPI0036354797
MPGDVWLAMLLSAGFAVLPSFPLQAAVVIAVRLRESPSSLNAGGAFLVSAS